MKKCPYCAGELEDTVIICHHCGKLLYTKKVSISSIFKDFSNREFNLSDIFRYLNLILIVIAIFTFFLPFAKFQMPIIGSQSVSGFSILRQSLVLQNEIKSQGDEGTPKMDIKSLKDMATSKSYEKYSGQRGVYRFIPVGLFCGVLAYLSLIMVALGLLFKKPLLSFITAVGSFIFSISFMISFFLLDDLLHYQMNSSMKKLEGNPFAGLATIFTQGVKIEPAVAIYLLIIITFFISVFSWLERKNTISQ